MNEEETKRKAEEEAKASAEQSPTDDKSEGVQSETAKDTERIRAETEKLNKAIAEKENAEARAKVSGVVVAGQKKEKDKEETNHEYHERIKKELREGKYDNR